MQTPPLPLSYLGLGNNGIFFLPIFFWGCCVAPLGLCELELSRPRFSIAPAVWGRPILSRVSEEVDREDAASDEATADGPLGSTLR